MSRFSRKKKTSVETRVQETTQNKIVKLSYVQSLALDNKIVSAGLVAGETKATEEKNKRPDQVSQNLLSRHSNQNPFADWGGKKTKISSEVDVKDSGWSLVRTWTQPQFDVIRYAIGVKDVGLYQFNYEPVSEFVSTSWAAPKEIIKVSLLVDQFIPPQFPPGNYIEYYVKSDVKDSVWVRINSIGSPTQFDSVGLVVPRIVNFNAERSVSSNLEESYISVAEPVKSIRFKAVLKRPEALDGYTPVLRSYRLKFTLRNGL